MKKSTKLITSAMLATAIISPNLAFATNSILWRYIKYKYKI